MAATDPGWAEPPAKRAPWWRPTTRLGWVIAAVIAGLVCLLIWVGYTMKTEPSKTTVTRPVTVASAPSASSASASQSAASSAQHAASASAFAASAAQAAASQAGPSKDPVFPPDQKLPPFVTAGKPIGKIAALDNPATAKKPKPDNKKPASTPKGKRPKPIQQPAPHAVPPVPMAVASGTAPAAPSATPPQPEYLSRVTLWVDSLPPFTFFTQVKESEKLWTAVNVDPCTPPACTLTKALSRTTWPKVVQDWFVDAETRIPAGTIMITPNEHRRPMWGTWGKNAFVFHSNVVAAWPSGKPEPSKHWWVTVGPRGERPLRVLTFHVAKTNACGNYEGWVEESSVPPAPLITALPPGRMPLGALPVVTCPH